MLWPESDTAHARHAPRDALHAIRRALGEDAAAVAAERWRDAALAWGGPLLEGFHVGDAPEFDQWLDEQRARALRGCMTATERLADAAEREARWTEAADWWASAIELDRCNSRLIAHRIAALARSGDPANAVVEGEALSRRLKEEFGLEPDTILTEQIQRVRRGELGPHHPRGAPLRAAGSRTACRSWRWWEGRPCCSSATSIRQRFHHPPA